MSATDAWELIFLMFVLKLPILYLLGVVVWAIRATAEPEPAVLVPARDDSPPRSCPWRGRHRAPRPTRPSHGSRRVTPRAAR